MKTFCGCGLRMHDYGGVEGVGIEECPWCASNGGNYCKSPYWPKKRDQEDAHKVRQGMAYKQAMQNVKPLKKDRRKAA